MLNLTRRAFLKGTSYLVAAAALPAIPFVSTEPEKLRIWADHVLIHDTIDGKSIGSMIGRNLFTITEVTAAGPRLIDLKDLPLQPFGNRIPNITIEEALDQRRIRQQGLIVWADKIKETSETELLGNGGFATEYKYFASWKVAFLGGV